MSDVNLTAVLYGAKDLRLVDKPIPRPGPGEVLINIKSVGICGSDVKYWQDGGIGHKKVESPIALGHEPSGVVVELGQGVTNLCVGDRVAVEPNMPCSRCVYCRQGLYNLCQQLKYLASATTNGALCRYLCHPAHFVYRLPDGISFDEGALVQPLSLGFYTCQRSGVKIGDYVLVTGAGPLGMSVVLAARACGVARICVTDRIQERLNHVHKFGADVIVLVNEADDATVTSQKVVEAIGREVDVSVECSGDSQATSTAIFATRARGIICQVGFVKSLVEIPLLAATQKELEIRCSIRLANCYQTAINALESGRVQVRQLVTHRFPLEQALKAFEAAYSMVGDKIIIDCERQNETEDH